jgi:hypothetical protein
MELISTIQEFLSRSGGNCLAQKTGCLFFGAALMTVCLAPTLTAAGERHLSPLPPLTINHVNQIIMIDRLIADRAYLNIKAGRPADSGIDFTLLDQEMVTYRPQLEKLDPAYYGALNETYERMKAYVTNPQSDFVRAIQKPGSVEFQGRNPLPAAFFDDNAHLLQNAGASARAAQALKQNPVQGVDELEEFLPDKAKATLSGIREMPETAPSEREAKLKVIEDEIAARGKSNDRLEAAVMTRILQGMKAKLLTPGILLMIDAADLPPGITPEMFDKMSAQPDMVRTDSATGMTKDIERAKPEENEAEKKSSLH